MMILAISLIVYPDVIYEAEWDVKTWIPFADTYGLILPVFLYIIAFIKKRKSPKVLIEIELTMPGLGEVDISHTWHFCRFI